MTLLQDDLYNSILVEPFNAGNVNTLNIVSGYATSAMAFHHLNYFSERQHRIRLNLTVGMVPRDGMSTSNHRGFVELMNNDFLDNFQCNYIINRPQVHTKLYVWCADNTPVQAFIGSANYTQTALSLGTQREVMSSCDADRAFRYFQDLQRDTIFCNHQDTENEILLVNDNYRRGMPSALDSSVNDTILNSYDSLPSAAVSLLGKDGWVQNVGGLNWGQREGREPNQAYLQLNPDVYRSNFFPIRTIHFTVLTDDGKSFICTRAQKSNEGQAIETPHNNSLLGEYFRNRLGLANGAFVKTSDLEKYGRTDIHFHKIDDETFYMDFSVDR
jgi:NgoFVII restriction endonuclease N-terminal PLD domain/NgoFVII C-terminal B3-like DNA-binding domain